MKPLRATIQLLGIIAVLCTVFLVAISVFYRFVLEDALRWGGEISTDLFVWSVFLGAALSAIDDEQLRFSMFLKRPGVSVLLKLFVHLIEFMTLAITLYFAVKITYLFRGNQMTSLDFPAIWALVAVPVGIAIVLLATLRDFFRTVSSSRGKYKSHIQGSRQQ